jgi:hypothetical protein
LDDAYNAWRALPMPPGSADDELASLHADLVLVDTWVAETVVPFVERTQYMFAAIDIGAGIRGVHERAEELAASLDGDEADLAQEYLAYADRLDAVYAELERAVEESGYTN